MNINKGKLTDQARMMIKGNLGIVRSSSKNKCKNCYYRPLDNICNKHHIITDHHDACGHYKKDIKFRRVRGGGVSPR